MSTKTIISTRCYITKKDLLGEEGMVAPRCMQAWQSRLCAMMDECLCKGKQKLREREARTIILLAQSSPCRVLMIT